MLLLNLFRIQKQNMMKKLITLMMLVLAFSQLWGHTPARAGEAELAEDAAGTFLAAASMLCLEVTSPDENSFWFSGTQVHIEWSSVAADFVNIFYSLDNGATWQLIEKNYPTGDHYNHYVWLVPEINGLFRQARIMVRNIYYDDHFAISPAFSLCSMPVIIREPEHWQVFVAGEDEVIPVEFEKRFDFALDYSIRWGLVFQPGELGSGTATQPGIYQQDVPLDENTFPGEYPLVISFELPGYNAQSIAQGPTLIIESTREKPRLEIAGWTQEPYFYSGDIQGFYWQAYKVDHINLYYSLDDGAPWEPLAQVYNNYGPTYNSTVFQVPAVETIYPQARLKIESTDDPGVFAISEPFTISPVPVEIRHPNAQTVLAPGEPLGVELYLWQDLQLELYVIAPDQGRLPLGILNGSAGLNTRDFEVPWTVPGYYKLLVVVQNIRHFTSEPFLVMIPGASLVSPDENSLWFSGNSYGVKWSPFGASRVDVLFSLDDGASWEIMEQGVIPTENYYHVNVPAGIVGVFPSARIMVRNTDHPAHFIVSQPFTISDPPVVIMEPQPGGVFDVGQESTLLVVFEKKYDYTMGYNISLISNTTNTIYDLGFAYITQPGVYEHVFELYDFFRPGQYTLEFHYFVSDRGRGIITMPVTVKNDAPQLAIYPSYHTEGGIAYAGRELGIRWRSLNVEQVNFHYSLDDGQSWNLIEPLGTSGGGPDGLENVTSWLVPDFQQAYPLSRFKIESAVDPQLFAITEAFTISPYPPVRILSPDDQTILTETDPLEVTVYVWHYGELGISSIDPEGNENFLGSSSRLYQGEHTFVFDSPGLVAGFNRVLVQFEQSQVLSEPFLVVAAGTTYPVTFSIDMSVAEDFNPDLHQVFVTGSFCNWAVPGTAKAIELVLSDARQLIYSATIAVAAGPCSFKYFSDAYGQGWDGGEWEGEPHREVMVWEETTLKDLWGAHEQVFFPLELLADPPEGGLVSQPGQSFNAGQQLELEASPQPGFVFKGWKKANGQLISQAPLFQYRMPAASTTLWARFEKATDSLKGFSLFPNPASRVVNIDSELRIEQLEITDLSGRVLAEKIIHDNRATLSVADLQPGIYLLRIRTPEGWKTGRIMIVPQ